MFQYSIVTVKRPNKLISHVLVKVYCCLSFFLKEKAHEQLMNCMQLAHLHIIKHFEFSIVFNIC